MTDIDDLKVQFYAVSGVLGFFIVILLALLINLYIKVYKTKNEEDDDDNDSRFTSGQRPPPPPVKSDFSIPKPSLSKNWHDNDAEIRRQNEEKERRIPKPDISKSWYGYPGDRDGGRKQNRYSDPRYDDDNSIYSYDGRKSPTSKSPGGAYRNPLTGGSKNESRFEFPESRSDPPRPPGIKSGGGGPSFLHHSGNDNHGYRRDFQRDNKYY